MLDLYGEKSKKDGNRTKNGPKRAQNRPKTDRKRQPMLDYCRFKLWRTVRNSKTINYSSIDTMKSFSMIQFR
jgi:hypothetical protein